jgi:small subunit ribosomal protein S18
VDKYREGTYVLFSSSPPRRSTVKELERRLRVSDMVLKFLTVRIDETLEAPGQAQEGARQAGRQTGRQRAASSPLPVPRPSERNPMPENRRRCPAAEGELSHAGIKGRPGSAGQRPTGGDKAVATQKKQYFRRKKVCRFCVEKIDDINYKDVKMLHAFVAERGKIVPRRISGVCAPHQRRLTDAIKKARNIALLPFAAQF